MADLLISRLEPGVARVTSVDPFDRLELYRIDRSHWQATPEKPGVYLLYGVAPAPAGSLPAAVAGGADDGASTPTGELLTVYIGMSTTSMRQRIRTHHATPKKNWFGVIFAVPVPSPLLCPAIEAELLRDMQEAGVASVIANSADERRHRDVDDVHLEPALDKIRAALQLMLGQDIFTAAETEPSGSSIDTPIKRLPALSRENRGPASEPRQRTTDDPGAATHGYVGAGVTGWGHFVGPEPDKRFVVLSGTGWREPKLDPEHATFDKQVGVKELQGRLIGIGVLDPDTHTFIKDHTFDNWGYATQVVSGKAQYSGSYHWQPLVRGA